MSRFPSATNPDKVGAALPIELPTRFISQLFSEFFDRNQPGKLSGLPYRLSYRPARARFLLQLRECCNKTSQGGIEFKGHFACNDLTGMKFWTTPRCFIAISTTWVADLELANATSFFHAIQHVPSDTTLFLRRVTDPR